MTKKEIWQIKVFNKDKKPFFGKAILVKLSEI